MRLGVADMFVVKELDDMYNIIAGVRNHAELYHGLSIDYVEGTVRTPVLRARWVALANYVNGCPYQRLKVQGHAAQWPCS